MPCASNSKRLWPAWIMKKPAGTCSSGSGGNSSTFFRLIGVSSTHMSAPVRAPVKSCRRRQPTPSRLPNCATRGVPIIPIRQTRSKKANRRLLGTGRGFDPHNHDPIKELASVPAAEPTHAPAVEVVAYRSRFGEPQELRFELHSCSFTSIARVVVNSQPACKEVISANLDRAARGFWGRLSALPNPA